MMRTVFPVPARPLRPLMAGLAFALMLLGSAGEAAERQKLRYQIEVAGVQLGQIRITAAEREDTVDAEIGWKMRSLLGLLERGEGSVASIGRIDGGEVMPASFKGRFEKPDRKREVRIRYGDDGAIEDLRLTSNGRERKSEVPERLRYDTVDTVTAFWRLRHWAVAGDDGRPLELAVFDGRRRYDLHARQLGRETAEIDGREVEAERIELRLVPRAGFDDDRVFGSRVDPDAPWAEVLVSVGDDPIPLLAIGRGQWPWRIVLDR